MEPSVDCKQIAELLDAYRDNELSLSERQSVEKHLQLCATCSAQLEDIGRIAQDIAALPMMALSRDIVGEIDFDALGDPFAQDGPVHSCATIVPILDAYHDKETSAEETSQVAGHIDECADCRQRLQEIGKLVTQLGAMPRVTMSRDLADSLPIVGGLAPVAVAAEKSNVVPFRRKAWFSAGAVAAAVVAVFAFNINKPQPQVVAEKKAPAVPAPKSPEAVQAPVVAEHKSIEATPVVAENKQTPAPRAVVNKKEAAPQIAPQVIANANKPAQAPEVRQSSQIRLAVNPAAEPVTQDNWEVAIVGEDDSSFTDAMGIATDEDGLYDIKI